MPEMLCIEPREFLERYDCVALVNLLERELLDRPARYV